MGKRSDFKRVEKDFYRTWDPRAVSALKHFLKAGQTFAEPCAGDGTLTDQLEALGLTCLYQYDIEPMRDDIDKVDALELTSNDVWGSDLILSNPPWSRNILHPMIERFANLKPTWLLFDSDWAYTKQSKELMSKYCTDIVVVGRLKWIEGTKMSGKDNCAWYRFSNQKTGPTLFHNL